MDDATESRSLPIGPHWKMYFTPECSFVPADAICIFFINFVRTDPYCWHSRFYLPRCRTNVNPCCGFICWIQCNETVGFFGLSIQKADRQLLSCTAHRNSIWSTASPIETVFSQIGWSEEAAITGFLQLSNNLPMLTLPTEFSVIIGVSKKPAGGFWQMPPEAMSQQ